MLIQRHDVQFSIDPEERYSVTWFRSRFAEWEEHSFDVLDRYLLSDRDFLDIGAWIGPLTLYAAHRSRRVFSLEPDPVAYERLQRNVRANENLNNISLLPIGLSDQSGPEIFGGNGELGNSESTLLVNDIDFLLYGGEKEHWAGPNPRYRRGEAVQANMMTFEDFVEEQAIDLNEVSLIKVDIEGSEKRVLPAMTTLLEEFRPTLFLSLHWRILKRADIERVLDIVYQIYPIVRGTSFQPVEMEAALAQYATSIIASAESGSYDASSDECHRGKAQLH